MVRAVERTDHFGQIKERENQASYLVREISKMMRA